MIPKFSTKWKFITNKKNVPKSKITNSITTESGINQEFLENMWINDLAVKPDPENPQNLLVSIPTSVLRSLLAQQAGSKHDN